MLDARAAAAGFVLRRAVEVSQFPTMLSHVRAGVGTAILPLGALPPWPWMNFHAYPLSEPRIQMRGGLISLRGRQLSSSASALAALIREKCREDAPDLRYNCSAR